MTALPRPKFPEERVLDLVVYVPLGLALTIAETVPELARKGRSRLEPQVRLARVVGQLAVKQGYKQAVRLAGNRLGNLRPKPGPPRAGQKDPGGPESPVGGATGAAGTSGAEDMSPGHPRGGEATLTTSARLAIPSYDALSAHQVVQRLAGLSREEVAAVRDYERSTRGRRTIITRAEQLLG
jgi:hypothetical protein